MVEGDKDSGPVATVVEVAGDVTDRCVKAMECGLKKVDETIPEEYSCSKKLCGNMRSFEDPAYMRCSTGRLAFFLLFLIAVAFVIIEAVFYDYWAEVAGGSFVAVLALVVAIFLGGDLFMFEAFKSIVNAMERQLKRLQANLTFYQNKLEDLGTVSKGLESVYEQMSGDEHAVAQLLSDMERLGKLQTIAAVTNQFYAADYDGSGHISGEEADLLFPQVTLLWDLAPSFDRQRVVEHVRANGMTIAQLSLILDALVEEDEEACTTALEALCDGKRIPPRSETEKQDWDAHSLAREEPGDMRTAPPDLKDPPDVPPDCEAPTHVVASVMQKEADHRMIPPEPIPGADKGPAPGDAEGEEEDVVKPLFSLPTCMPERRLGPIGIGGRCSVWGYWHLAACVCVLIQLLLLVLVVLGLEMHHIMLNTVGLCLAMGLTGAGKLVEILRHLRRQAKEFKAENERLECLNTEFADKVTRLQKLKLGYDKLQELCAGNVAKATDLLKESETKVKMEAMASIMHLFKQCDASRNMKLEQAEKESFFGNLEPLLRRLPGFDMAAIRSIVGDGDMTHKQIKAIIDVVAGFKAQTSTPADEAASSVLIPGTVIAEE